MFCVFVLLNCSIFLCRAAVEELAVSTHNLPITSLSRDVQVPEKDGKEHEGACARTLGESTTWAEHEPTGADPSFPIWKEGIFMDIVHSIT